MQLVRTAQPKHKINLLSLSTEAGGPDVGHLVCSINSMYAVRPYRSIQAQTPPRTLLALSTEDGGPPGARVRSPCILIPGTIYVVLFA